MMNEEKYLFDRKETEKTKLSQPKALCGRAFNSTGPAPAGYGNEPAGRADLIQPPVKTYLTRVASGKGVFASRGGPTIELDAQDTTKLFAPTPVDFLPGMNTPWGILIDSSFSMIVCRVV